MFKLHIYTAVFALQIFVCCCSTKTESYCTDLRPQNNVEIDDVCNY